MDQEKANRFRKGIHNSINIEPSSQPVPNQIPVIRTFEDDILDQVRSGNIDQRKVLVDELDSRPFEQSTDIYAAAEQVERKKKIIIISSIILGLLILFGGGFVYYYYNYIRVVPQPVVEVPVKVYTVADIWTNPTTQLISYTSTATTTESSIIVSIKDFNALYYYVLNNENIFNDVARNKFHYNSVDKFSDISVQNNDLRIADGESGPLVYGFVDKKFLVISNSLESWLKTADSVK